MHHKYSLLEQCQKHRVFFVRTMPKAQRKHGQSNKITLPQHSSTSRSRQVKNTSFGQKTFSCQSESGSSDRKTKINAESWEKLTQDLKILSIVHGFKIPFSQTRFQYVPPQLARMNQEERLKTNSEIKDIFSKGAIQQVK